MKAAVPAWPDPVKAWKGSSLARFSDQDLLASSVGLALRRPRA